jgi:ABC-type antimicrobial peptide transport system permease subunit
MIKNYLKTAWRNLIKDKSFSLINVSGLALGMASSLLITLWVSDETSIDKFNKESSRLYSVYERQFYQGKTDAFHSTPGLMAEELKKAFPEIEYASGFGWLYGANFNVGDKIIKKSGSWAGPDFFRMFDYPLLQGDRNTALNDPSSIAVSRTMAESFFGTVQNAFNKILRFENKKDFKITAVFENIGSTTSNKFDYLINWDAYLDDNAWLKDWTITISDGPKTYLKLRPGTDGRVVENKIRNFLDGYFKEQRSGFHVELGLQRFDEMYLRSQFKNGKIDGGRIEYVRLFTIIAIFVLLIACVNFMNLSTARFIKRAKEIGVRKVVGAVKNSLVKQFLGEAMMTTLLSLGIALIIVLFLLPSFNNFSGKQITLPVTAVGFWLGLLGLALITGLISGSYPAFFLSSLDPIKVLKGSVKAGPRAILFRKGLVIFQFSLSIILIIGTIVVSRQVQYIQTKNLGYNKENVISIPLEGTLLSQYKTYKLEALNVPGVRAVSRITQVPTKVTSGTSDVSWQNKDADEKTLFIWASVGYDFAKLLNLQFLEGRDFSKEYPTDSSGYILNESALRAINYKDPIGKQFTFWGRQGTIIGVVKDFHFNSLHDPIRPLILRLGESEKFGHALVKIDPARTKQALAGLAAVSKQFNPRMSFTFEFLDDSYRNLYTGEQTINRLSSVFSVLAIVICCLGLLGLVMFTAEQRIKEIGIRKVLGASNLSVFIFYSKDFITLVLVAFAIASPVAWWATQSWIKNYTYHVEIGWWIFLIAGIMSVLIALVTISFQAIRAATVNPIKSLRRE